MTKGIPSIIRTAHGAASDALLVAETPPLDEHGPPNPARTAEGLALRRRQGRPFQRGNTAASGRGPSLTRIPVDPSSPEERKRRDRKANSLKSKRLRELCVQVGMLTLSSAVAVELKSWACATADAEALDRANDPIEAAKLREKASGHQLKAIAFAEREAAANDAAKNDAKKKKGQVGNAELYVTDGEERVQ